MASQTENAIVTGTHVICTANFELAAAEECK